MRNDKQTTTLALGRRAVMNLVWWGGMEEGLRFHGRGEGDLVPTVYEWGIGRGNHVLRTHLSKMWGSYSSTPAFWLLGLGLFLEGRG